MVSRLWSILQVWCREVPNHCCQSVIKLLKQNVVFCSSKNFLGIAGIRNRKKSTFDYHKVDGQTMQSIKNIKTCACIWWTIIIKQWKYFLMIYKIQYVFQPIIQWRWRKAELLIWSFNFLYYYSSLHSDVLEKRSFNLILCLHSLTIRITY